MTHGRSGDVAVARRPAMRPFPLFLCGAFGATLLFSAITSATPVSPWVSTATKALPPVAAIARSPVAANMPMHVIVSLQLRNKAGLQAFIRNQHTPGSPQYGVMLSNAD